MNAKLLNKFWSKVKKTGGCWNWTGGKFSEGYGAIWIQGKQKRAHRISWEIHNGKIPKGLLICHSCDNPACVRPIHLFLGTNKDNMQDKAKKGRNVDQWGVKNHAHKLTENQVRTIRELGKTGNLLHRKIGELFNISQPTVTMIINRQRWNRS